MHERLFAIANNACNDADQLRLDLTFAPQIDQLLRILKFCKYFFQFQFSNFQILKFLIFKLSEKRESDDKRGSIYATS
jgi:hypothetical protein